MQEDKSRVKIFRDSKQSTNIWQPFLNLLNRQDEFVQHMTARIIAKLACWHPELMDKSDLHFYLSWLKDQLKMNVSWYNFFLRSLKLFYQLYFLCMDFDLNAWTTWFLNEYFFYQLKYFMPFLLVLSLSCHN